MPLGATGVDEGSWVVELEPMPGRAFVSEGAPRSRGVYSVVRFAAVYTYTSKELLETNIAIEHTSHRCSLESSTDCPT